MSNLEKLILFIVNFRNQIKNHMLLSALKILKMLKKCMTMSHKMSKRFKYSSRINKEQLKVSNKFLKDLF